MNTQTTNPTPDAALAALCDADFDLPLAAKALLIPLTLLLRLLKSPEYAEPLNQFHELSKQCLDIRAARVLARSLELLDAAYDKSEDPAEHRRIATAVTKAANATARLTKPPRTTDRRSGRSVPTLRQSAGASPDPWAENASAPRAPIETPPAEPELHPEVAAAFEKVREAWTALRATPPRITHEEFARIYNECKALEAHFSPGPAHAAA